MTTSKVRLAPHPTSSTARDCALAIENCEPGDVVFTVPCFASVLLPTAKGHRCDSCHSMPSRRGHLQRCSGCGVNYYCDQRCQEKHWTRHRRMCKIHSKLIVSVAYQALLEHERLDVALLHEAMAEIGSRESAKDDQTEYTGDSDPDRVFMSLLPGPSSNPKVSDICISKATPKPRVEATYSRFANNNFTIHSHLVTYAHGIFPMASRLFNHSCIPNAMPRYIIQQGEPVLMEVIAISSISANHEVSIPYLDPALPLTTREQMLEYTYGFRCTCAACTIARSFNGSVPVPPASVADCASLLANLRQFVFRKDTANQLGPREELTMPDDNVDMLEQLPEGLKCILHEAFLPMLSEEFSELCHEQRDAPLEVGESLLALYLIVYPKFYPQTGMHLLELAKATWNQLMITTTIAEGGAPSARSPPKITDKYIGRTKEYLGLAKRVLRVLGEEGDQDGQLVEIATLMQLVAEEESQTTHIH